MLLTRKVAIILTAVAMAGGIRPPPSAADQPVRQLPVQEYRDRMKAAWLGQMVGVSWGYPTEFNYNGRIIPADEVPAWYPSLVNDAFDQDDLYVEMTFLRTLELYGLGVSIIQAGSDFAASQYRLWHANNAGRENLRGGILPPDSGHPTFNRHADDIDYQIEADFSGLIAPGLPNAVIAMGEKFGRLMNYGDGLYGGQFVGGMYAEAFFETDPVNIVQAGLACIPAGSQYAEAVQDMLNWYDQDPDNWQNTWQLLMNKYHWDPDYRRFSCDTSNDFNIDAKLNGAYVVMGLLYGQRDFDDTIVTAMRCGEDSDCNPSTAAGVLFATVGFSGVPDRFKSALDNGLVFSYTAYNFPQLIDVCETLARQVVIDSGGWIEDDGGEEVFVIPVQTPDPSALEQCWEPGPTCGVEIFRENFDSDPFNGRWTQPGDVGYLTNWYDACGPDIGYIYSECPSDKVTTYTGTPFTTEGYTDLTLSFYYTHDYGHAIKIDLLRDGSWVNVATSASGTHDDWTRRTVSLSDDYVYTGIRANLRGIGGHWNDWRRVDCISITGYPAPPTITQQPQSQRVWEGGAATFSVTAGGEGTLSYQWQRNGSDLTSGGKISGADGPTLQIIDVNQDDEGNYRCVVAHGCRSVTSDQAALTVPLVPDFDQDGDVDQEDFGFFQACFSGSGAPCEAGCRDADVDDDDDVDMEDFGLFQTCMGGANNPPGC